MKQVWRLSLVMAMVLTAMMLTPPASQTSAQGFIPDCEWLLANGPYIETYGEWVFASGFGYFFGVVQLDAGDLLFITGAQSSDPDQLEIWLDDVLTAYGPYPDLSYIVPVSGEFQLEFILRSITDGVYLGFELGCIPAPVDVPTDAAEVELVPGCDVLIEIPSTAVGATITEDTPVYWKPDEMSDETFAAGLNVRALGVDESGMYTKVLFACGYYWVPSSVIGPNYDDVWQGAPLPTDMVE